MVKSHKWDFEIKGMPHLHEAMQRVEAWFEQEVIDRPPIRFSKHNVQYEKTNTLNENRWNTLKDRWFDAEYQVDAFIKSIESQTFPAETFPVFWPNLGPDIYAAFFGAELEFGEITSWSIPKIMNLASEIEEETLTFTAGNPYFRKIQELTDLAFQKCDGRYFVGETCWCPGIDCVAAWRGSQQLE